MTDNELTSEQNLWPQFLLFLFTQHINSIVKTTIIYFRVSASVVFFYTEPQNILYILDVVWC